MTTKNVYRYVFIALATGLLTAGLGACSGKKGKKAATPVPEETIRKEVQEYIYPLPSAFEVTNMLNEIEASYIVGISNDPEKAETYFSEKDKAFNLGIYAADLAYATTYNQKTEVNTYFSACEKLARELDITSAFNQDLPDQIEANLDNKGKMVELVTGMFDNAYAYLNKRGRTELSYLVLSGTVVEGLYLTTHISGNTFQNPKLIGAILFQKKPLQDLEKMMETYKETELLKQAYLDIQAINAIYALEEGTTSMTLEQVTKLTEAVNVIRDGKVK
ncbi:MAG: hypothetical protein AB7D05_07100 [Mangrovibacterium sp.]